MNRRIHIQSLLGTSLLVLLQASHAAEAGPPIAPERLAPLLPAKTWGDAKRQKPSLESKGPPFPVSSAEVVFQGERGGKLPYVTKFTLSDPGAATAKVNAMMADYLRRDMKSDSQETVVLPNGRRGLMTLGTATSMGIETQVAGRWGVRVDCIDSTKARCVEAFGQFDFAAIEALKP